MTEETQDRVEWRCSHWSCEGKGTYSLEVICTNCSWEGEADLTLGHEFSQRTMDCPRCECSSLTRLYKAAS